MSRSYDAAPEGPRGIRLGIALFGLALLWAAVFVDAVQWIVRLQGGFSSKTNLLSHVWPYISFGGALAGLLARGMPNYSRSIPTVWLLVSLAAVHGAGRLPKGALPPAEGPTLRVMTLNRGEIPGTRDRLYPFLRQRRNVDVLFLQEVRGGRFRDRPRLEAALGGRLRHAAWELPATARSFEPGLAIMSRYPLENVRALKLPAGELPPGRCRRISALAARTEIRGRGVRLVTAHLCPPALPWRDTETRSVGFSLGAISGWFNGGRAFEYARRTQLMYLRTIADGGVEPIILGGDLNTTPHSLDIRELSGGLTDAFGERGQGFGFTYSAAYLSARIDHIFHSGGIAARSASVLDADVSDHKPLEAVLEILPKRGKR